MSFIMSPSCQCHSSSIHIPDLICKDFKNKVLFLKIEIAVPHHILWLVHFCGKNGGGGGVTGQRVYMLKKKNQLHEILTQTVDKILCEYVNIS